jgi:hypothetical protein
MEIHHSNHPSTPYLIVDIKYNARKTRPLRAYRFPAHTIAHVLGNFIAVIRWSYNTIVGVLQGFVPPPVAVQDTPCAWCV